MNSCTDQHHGPDDLPDELIAEFYVALIPPGQRATVAVDLYLSVLASKNATPPPGRMTE